MAKRNASKTEKEQADNLHQELVKAFSHANLNMALATTPDSRSKAFRESVEALLELARGRTKASLLELILELAQKCTEADLAAGAVQAAIAEGVAVGRLVRVGDGEITLSSAAVV